MSKTSLFIMGACAGAFLISAVGFTAFGWKLDAKAQVMAEDAASAAVAKILVPACIASFRSDGDVARHTAMLEGTQFFQDRVAYVEKEGWAMLAGQERAVSGIARACTEGLPAPKT